jgi:nucleoside-diphosphate-sugar epimerase
VPPEREADPAPEALAGRTVAITGASGYIGTALVARLAALGARVVRVTRDARRLPPPPGGAACRDVEGSLGDAAPWHRALEGAHALVHLAGETSAAAAEQDPAASWRDSVAPIERMAEAARAAPALRCVVLAGSATQYGLGERLPVREDDPDRPPGVYEQHKCAAEAEARARLPRGVAVVAARLANVYGPGAAPSSPDRGVLTRMVARAAAGEALRVFAPGDWLRDYVDVDDVAEALAWLAAAGERIPEGRALVCSGRSVPLVEAARMAARAAERRTGVRVAVEVVPPPRPLLPVETRQFSGTPERLGALGWRARVALGDGLGRTAEALVPAAT